MEKVVVTCLRGARVGARFEFRKSPITFGRREDSDVTFPLTDSTASGRHAEMRQVDGRWFLRDLGSMNGTWVQDRQLTMETEVGDGTVIEFGQGGPRFRVEFVDPETRVLPATDFVRIALPPERRPTAFFKALMDDRLKKSSARLKAMMLALVAVVLVASLLLWWALSRETDRLSGESEAAQAASRAAETIASRYSRSIFMLIAANGPAESGFCTAFAISADGVLVTNAHCVRELKDHLAAGARGVRILARMNTAPERTYEVGRWKEHPAYDGSAFSPDVALLGLTLPAGESLPVVAELAAPEAVLALAPGQAIFTIGFPGQVMNEARPAADLRAAVVSRLTTAENTSGDARSAYVVWHSALTSKGTSGSPIFDALGRVVAVNNGGLSARELLVADPATGQVRRELISEATGLNFGIRADRLAELLHTR